MGFEAKAISGEPDFSTLPYSHSQLSAKVEAMARGEGARSVVISAKIEEVRPRIQLKGFRAGNVPARVLAGTAHVHDLKIGATASFFCRYTPRIAPVPLSMLK